MTNAPDRHARAMLPIPDRPATGLTTYDAKDPDTAFPPIEPLLPPEGAPNVGYESGTSVTSDYSAGTSRFTGKIAWVRIDLGDDDHDHVVDPDERLRIAMARQ